MTRHNVAKLTCEPCPEGGKFTVRATLDNGGELSLTGEAAIGAFHALVDCITEPYTQDKRVIH